MREEPKSCQSSTTRTGMSESLLMLPFTLVCGPLPSMPVSAMSFTNAHMLQLVLVARLGLVQQDGRSPIALQKLTHFSRSLHELPFNPSYVYIV